MFGSDILEVAIGLSFLYLILSLIVTTLTEFISRVFAMRSSNLEDGVRNLLEDPETMEKFYKHPLIANLANKDKGVSVPPARKGKPSYIPSRSFALALMDVVAPREANGDAKPVHEVRQLVNQLPESLRAPLLTALDEAKDDMAKMRAGVEGWFDASMDRVSGWYRRKAQLITVALGIAIAGLINADTFSIANSLFRDDEMRAAVVAAAVKKVEEGGPGKIEPKEIEKSLDSLRVPLGWSKTADAKEWDRPVGLLGWIGRLAGLLFTGLAVSLGAPFWFDALNRLVNLRATGPPPKPSAGDSPPKPPVAGGGGTA